MSELKIYTVKEVSELLKVSERTVREYITKRQIKPLKAVKRGKRYLITEENLKEFMSDN